MASRNRGRIKPKLRDLSRKPPTLEEKEALSNILAQLEHHPIVTAIIGASHVEFELERLIRGRIRRSDDDTWEALTNSRAPLESFSAKILMAYALGAIDTAIRDALDTIRVVRNAFAHSKRLVSFDHELVVKELATVTMPKKKRSRLHKDLRNVNDGTIASARARFIILCYIVSSEIIRIETQALKASTRRKRRRVHQNFFAGVMGSQPTGALSQGLGLFGQALRDDHTWRPTQSILSKWIVPVRPKGEGKGGK